MHFPKSLHADGWHAHMPRLLARRGRPSPATLPVVSHDSGLDSPSPRRHRRGWQALVVVAGLGLLAAAAGPDLLDDPRPLDVRLSAALRDAGRTLQDWQGQLSRGLQVSLRAVADGSDQPAAAPAAATLLALDADAEADEPVALAPDAAAPQPAPTPAPLR